VAVAAVKLVPVQLTAVVLAVVVVALSPVVPEPQDRVVMVLPEVSIGVVVVVVPA
jgi:hypothetical protein